MFHAMGIKIGKESLSYIFLVLAQVMFGAAGTIYKLGLQSAEPLVLILYRQLSGGPLLLVAALIIERNYPKKEDILSFLLVGFVGIFLTQTLFMFGILFAGAIITAVIQLLTPPITSVISIAMKMESFAILKVVGLVLSIAGAAIMVGVDKLSFDGSDNKALGVCMLVAQAIFSSLYIILVKRLFTEKYPPITITAGVNCASVPFILVLTFILLPIGERWSLHGFAIWSLVYAIMFVALLGYSLFSFAVKYTDPTVVAASSTINPIVASTAAVLILNEPFGLREGIGAALIILGFSGIIFQKYRENKNSAVDEATEHLIDSTNNEVATENIKSQSDDFNVELKDITLQDSTDAQMNVRTSLHE